MKRRSIYIALFIISIIGLAVVQYQYLKIGLTLAKVQFNQQIGVVAETIKKDLSTNNQLTFLIGSALEKDVSFFKVSQDSLENASNLFLKDFITYKLVYQGIETDFSYKLYAKNTPYYLTSPVVFNKNDKIAMYPIELSGYLPKLIDERLILELTFKDLNHYYLSQLNGLTLPSLLFILGIIVTIIWVLRTYYWQHNLIVMTNEFINNLTHELKTPVFSIGVASKILAEKVDDDQRHIVSIIRQQVERLTDHIDKILEIGSLESNKKSFKLQEVNFRPFLEKLCQEYKTLVSMEDVSFSYKLETGRYLINAEVFHLENALNNVLDNAKKYSDNPIITLKATIEHSELWIRISDNGMGIDQKDKKSIFKKYYRVPRGDLYKVKGYGLGLSYVKKVVEYIKGKILIESEKGKGTTVAIIIPLV
ncbi:two-component sensor histidine kinase [Gramella sp. AN32]|nr:two-component sensor histidine kinase [Gramella sp. AN32]